MSEALYRVLKNLISKGKLENLENKIDIFYAANKITDSQYNELIQSIKNTINK